MIRCFFKKLIYLFICLYTSFSFAQQSEIEANLLAEYSYAKKLYNSKAYAAAQPKFLSVLEMAINSSNLKADASYYEAMCAIKLNETDADKKVIAFVENFPNSTKKNTAFYNVGNYYFANKKAAHALKWYEKVDVNSLSTEDKKEHTFKSGYSFLTTNNFTAAQEKFITLINDPKYGNDSRYYYGYIAYKQKNYDLAEQTLTEIAENKTYKEEISYYLLDISFQGGKFENSIKIGEKLLETPSKKNRSDISKIIGESYFNLEKYAAAIPYLKEYKGDRNRWNNTDYYQLGFAYFKQDDFINAINNFNKIIGGKDKIAQNAYYNLGECYLKIDKKTEALNAFKTASEMSFNQKIKEDAALNYAKLSYEEGNPFHPVSSVLQDYLKEYPASKSYRLIEDLLVTSFISQQDYQGALDFLAQSKTSENSEKAHEISLYRGIQLFNDNKIQNSISYFLNAKKSGNKEISARAHYWDAETNYLLEDHKNALDKFIVFKKITGAKDTEEYNLIDYNIGYSYFKLKEYKQAANYFEDFLSKTNENTDEKKDALIRLADCEFATKEYQKAIKTYQKIITNNSFGADYAEFQKAISYGFIGENKQKIEGLKRVVNNYPNSNLQDDALFQIGATYATLNETKNAHEAFNKLLSEHNKSVFIPKTLVRQGLVFYIENKNDAALKSFKEVVKRYPNSQESLEAVSNAEKIYIDNGNIDEYVSWIKTLKFINIENSDIDNTRFASAEKKFLESDNNEDKISSLLSYMKNFPKGIHSLKANFYLAQTYYKAKNYKPAAPAYQFVVNQGQNDFSEESLAKLAQIYLFDEDYKNAIPLLKRLEQEAFSAENIVFAQRNLMQGYYKTDDFEMAINYAKKVLQKDKLDTIIANDAKIIIARSAIKKEDFSTAEEFYTSVEKNAEGELKAEALHYKALFEYNKKNYEASNKIVQHVIANYSSYKYWGVKSYVIMAKNYYGLKDVYQATYVLENIIENFGQFENVIAEAQKELNTIKTNEAKNNNSIQPKKQ